MGPSILALFFALVLCAASSPVFAKRVALVIGNNVYRNLPSKDQLKNAVSDARVMKAALESLNFNVVLGENLDRTALIGKLSDFGARLEEGDVAFFFYAGHGVSFSGTNYLLPSDIPAPQASGRGEEERLADLAVAETRIDERIRRSGARIAVVALDACRDNPLSISSGRSIGAERGLAPPPQTNGVLSIYSAGAGRTALDDLGDGDPNSVFTRVFVKYLKTPGLGLREIAFKTQGEVAKLASANGYDQVPGIYSEIIGDDFYLAEPPAAPATPDTNSEQADFTAALRSGSAAQLDMFLRRYPGSALADIVRRERDRLTQGPDRPVASLPSPATSPTPLGNSEQMDFASAMRTGSAAGLDLFLTRYPGGALADVVRRERDRLANAPDPPDAARLSIPAEKPTSGDADETDWDNAKLARTQVALRNFIRDFPGSKRRHEAEILLTSLSPPNQETGRHIRRPSYAERDRPLRETGAHAKQREPMAARLHERSINRAREAAPAPTPSNKPDLIPRLGGAFCSYDPSNGLCYNTHTGIR